MSGKNDRKNDSSKVIVSNFESRINSKNFEFCPISVFFSKIKICYITFFSLDGEKTQRIFAVPPISKPHFFNQLK